MLQNNVGGIGTYITTFCLYTNQMWLTRGCETMRRDIKY